MGYTKHLLAVRAQALTLVAVADMPVARVAQITGMTRANIYLILRRAKERGYNPTIDPCIRDEYVADGKRSGRPKEISEATEKAVLESVTKDRAGREKAVEYLAYEAGISRSSAYRILKKHGFRNVKPTWKPGLSGLARDRRLAFCLAHQHWTLEDWKNVIWTDETSVVLGHRRGSQRVWRRVFEVCDRTVIRRRFKKASEFMFWGSFSYDKKGPCHIYDPETAAAKKEAERDVATMNEEREARCKEAWEMETMMARLQLGVRRGRKPQWRFSAKTGKLVRKSKGGVDWYRYQKV